MYKEAAAVCIKNNSAAVYNEDTEKFECETLLERGSCLRPNQQRILIERPDPYKLWPSCQERCDDVNPYKLPFGQLNGPCVSMGDQDVCENSEVVKPTFYGYGNCSRIQSRNELEYLEKIRKFKPSSIIVDHSDVANVQKNCVTNAKYECVEIVEIIKVQVNYCEEYGWCK